MEIEQPGQLCDGPRVVVDAQVHEDVAAAAVPIVRSDDEQRRALPPALVTTGVVSGRERSQESPAEGLAGFGGPPRRVHRLDDLRAGEDVALDREATVTVDQPGDTARPRVAPLAGERRRVARGVHDAGLPLRALLVGRGEALERLLRRLSLAEQTQAVG